MRRVAMQVVVYRTPCERIAYAERVIRRSLNTSFNLIERRRLTEALAPALKAILLREAQERRYLKTMVARWRVELAN